MYERTTKTEDLPIEAYPFVLGEVDEHAARRAYFSTTALLDYRAEHQGDKPFFCPIDIKSVSHKTYTFKQTREMVVRFAKAHHGILPARKKDGAGVVVGIIGLSGEDSWFHDRALHRLGHIPLHMSLQLGYPAVKALLEQTGATYLLAGPGSESIVNQMDLPLKRVKWFTVDQAPSLDPDAGEHANNITLYRSEIPLDQEIDETCMIYHSTGSTGNPKPVPFRHRVLGNVAAIDGPLSPPAHYPLLTLTPTYHTAATSMITHALGRGDAVFVAPSMAFTPDNLRNAIMACEGKAKSMFAVPIFLQHINSLPDGMSLLSHFKQIRVAGGPTPPAIAEMLIEKGVLLQNIVASTELSPYMCWQWLSVPTGMEKYTKFEEHDPETGSSELIALPGHPRLYVSNRPDGSYATSDLFIPHPTIPGKWKYDKRKDDVIVHSTAAMSDPLVIEAILTGSPLISQAMVIGKNKPHVVALIIPNPNPNSNGDGKSVNVKDLEELFETVNNRVPVLSRLYTDRVQILSPEDTFVISAKGVAIRGQTEKKYEEVIESIYANSSGLR